jgi:hypothetical protein
MADNITLCQFALSTSCVAVDDNELGAALPGLFYPKCKSYYLASLADLGVKQINNVAAERNFRLSDLNKGTLRL